MKPCGIFRFMALILLLNLTFSGCTQENKSDVSNAKILQKTVNQNESVDGILNFSFQDSSGNIYNSISCAQQFKERFNGTHVTSLILLMFPKPNHPLFIEQQSVLDSLDSEQLQFIIIMACSSGKLPDVYHTDTTT